MNFKNSYVKLPGSFFSELSLEAAPKPKLISINKSLAGEFNFDLSNYSEDELAKIFSGTTILPDAHPIATAYAGHQFGHFSPQLGDGRAALLGEITDVSGTRFDIQLKGSGRTPFSRGGDGKSALGPVIREYILSEAMHKLGVPTTRALAAVTTGETVFREGPVPGGIFTRVASSHLRIGTFEYFCARNQLDDLAILADYAIKRHFPDILESSDPYTSFFRQVTEKQAKLVAHWMSVGFIHGVMNTDNTSIAGETLDYGPAAYLDEFNFQKVFSSIDQHGRYAYINQPGIAQWNLARLAESLLAIGADRSMLEEILGNYPAIYEKHYLDLMRPKLGLYYESDEDAGLLSVWLQILHDNALDFTLSFRELANSLNTSSTPISKLPGKSREFEELWRKRLAKEAKPVEEVKILMNSVNPLYIPRNHRVEQAISAAINGDYSILDEMVLVLDKPFVLHAELNKYAEAPEVRERVTRTFCGT